VNLSEEIIRVLVTHAEHLNETEMAAVERSRSSARGAAAMDRPYGFDDRRPPRRDDRPDSGPMGKD